MASPKGSAEFVFYRGHFEALLQMPSDALSPVLQMAMMSQFRFVELTGERLRYGRARITSFRLETNTDEEDMADDW